MSTSSKTKNILAGQKILREGKFLSERSASQFAITTEKQVSQKLAFWALQARAMQQSRYYTDITWVIQIFSSKNSIIKWLNKIWYFFFYPRQNEFSKNIYSRTIKWMFIIQKKASYHKNFQIKIGNNCVRNVTQPLLKLLPMY